MMSPMRGSRWLLLLSGAAVALPRVVAAQHSHVEPLTIHLTSTVGAEVVSSIGGVRQDLAKLIPNQALAVPGNALNVGKGQRTQVVIDHSTVSREDINDIVVLTDDISKDPQCRAGAAAGVVGLVPSGAPPAHQCRVLGTFPWREISDLTVARSAAGEWAIQTTGNPQTLTLGAGISYNQFTSLKSVGCDRGAIAGLTGCSVAAGKPGLALSAEYHLADAFRIGAEYNRTSYQVHQMYGGDALDHNVTVQSFGGFVQVRPPHHNLLTPFAAVEVAWLHNASKVYQGTRIMDRRTQGGWRKGGCAGVDVGLTDRIGLRAELGYHWGGGGDADSHVRAGTGLTFTF
ncbi:MAG: outer membrane beta-barrel protein [Gemmatimonadales bacterium]